MEEPLPPYWSSYESHWDAVAEQDGGGVPLTEAAWKAERAKYLAGKDISCPEGVSMDSHTFIARDLYLALRQPEWAHLEAAGQVLEANNFLYGQSIVFVERTCWPIMKALHDHHTRAKAEAARAAQTQPEKETQAQSPAERRPPRYVRHAKVLLVLLGIGFAVSLYQSPRWGAMAYYRDPGKVVTGLGPRGDAIPVFVAGEAKTQIRWFKTVEACEAWREQFLVPEGTATSSVSCSLTGGPGSPRHRMR